MLFRQRERKTVGHRKCSALLTIAESVGNTFFRHRLDPKPKPHEARSPAPLHLVVIKNVGNREFVRESKESLQQASSLQIDQHGGVGDEDHCNAAGAGSSMRRLSSRTVIFNNSAVLGSRAPPSGGCGGRESIKPSPFFLGLLFRFVVWSAPVF